MSFPKPDVVPRSRHSSSLKLLDLEPLIAGENAPIVAMFFSLDSWRICWALRGWVLHSENAGPFLYMLIVWGVA